MLSNSANKIKYRYYESDAKMTVEVPIKNVSEDQLKISFAPEKLSVTVNLPNDDDYHLEITLYNTIFPDQCSYKIRPSKVEIFLAKQVQIRWGKLEKDLPASSTSSTSKQKNWDKVVKESLTDQEESIQEVFAKIFEAGDDDQKRAMMKSFNESCGTVLSTNWKDVGAKKVEVKPPEGVEYKPWK